jgi:hypothetical protein
MTEFLEPMGNHAVPDREGDRRTCSPHQRHRPGKRAITADTALRFSRAHFSPCPASSSR